PNTGDNITYTITVTNNGPGNAINIDVFDFLPFIVSYVSDSPSQGSYDDSIGIWFMGDLNDGLSATLNITVTVWATHADGTITNTAILPSYDEASADFEVP
ncbi:DUF11 domain-containing protein, partial [Chloroflexota bacterium]